MRILFLCTYYHRAMIFRDSMDRLNKLGHKVDVFNAVVYNTKIDEKYNDIMDDLVIHKECFNKWDRFFYHIKQRKIYQALISAFDINKYDLIHSHTLFNGGYVAYQIRKYFGVPYVVSIRNTDMNTFLKIPLFVSLANKIVRDASGIQFLSTPYKEKFINKYVKAELKENIENKSVVIGNGLEDFWLTHKSKVKKLDKHKSINILCVGKIDKNKNITTTIKSIKLLIEKGYDVIFTVVGQLVEKSVLKEIQMISFVRIISYLSKEQLINVYRDNDIYIMPSINETFGRVYAEAMTQGLPIIYTQGQGFDGIFPDGCVGYAVPCNNADYIAECVLKIISDYSNISARCIKYCDKFNWDAIARNLNQFYYESLERGKIR